MGTEASSRTRIFRSDSIRAGVCLGAKLADHVHMMFYELGCFHSKGITVSVLRDVPIAENGDRWTEPLVLRVQGAGAGLPRKLFLNSKPLRWEELNGRLGAGLGQRSVWVVYVEADSNVSWQD